MIQTRSGTRSPRRAHKKVKARIQKVKSKIQDAKKAGKKNRVKKLKTRVKGLREKKQELTKKIQAQKATRLKKTIVATTAPTTSPTAYSSGNIARNTLATTKRRVRPINYGISGQNPLD